MTLSGPTIETQKYELDKLLNNFKLSAELLQKVEEIHADNVMEREHALNEINNELIAFSLKTSTPQRLDISGCGATRASSHLLAFLEKHATSLETIVLSDNAFTSLTWLKNYTIPNLKVLDISSNPLSADYIKELKMDYFMVDLITDKPDAVLIPTARTKKPLTNQFKNQQPSSMLDDDNNQASNKETDLKKKETGVLNRMKKFFQ